MPSRSPFRAVNGSPGESWTNDTGKVWFQLKVQFRNSCGLCIQYANQVAPYWPIPFHSGCNCEQSIIRPGETADAFVDFQKELEQLPLSQKIAAVGASNWKLIDKGVVAWEDVVTPSRIRNLREVVAREKLSDKALREAGINRVVRSRVLGAVASPENIANEVQRAGLVSALRNNGVSEERIRQELTTGLARKVNVVGPTGANRISLSVPSFSGPRSGITTGGLQQTNVEPYRGPTMNTEIERRLKEYTEGDRKIAELAKGMRDPDAKRKQYLDGMEWMAQERAAGRTVSAETAKLINSHLEDASRIREANSERVREYLKAEKPVTCMADTGRIRAKGDKAWIEKAHDDVWSMIAAKSENETAFDVSYRFTRATDEGDRAFWDPKSGTVVLSKVDGNSIVAHELGHKLETQYRTVKKFANEFLAYRQGDESLKPMALCNDDEMGIDDDFSKVYPNHPRYVGKRYDSGDTEIVAIGLQMLFEAPHRLIRDDPEYGKFILGILDGTFR